ncbi:MAG: response regulator [Candidatus Peregrinibacteria bacterium]
MHALIVPDKNPPKSSAVSARKKLLIVEDERPLAHALELKFTHEGFHPRLANGGADALEAIKKESFDVILLDLIMPEVDGFAVLKALQEKKAKSPVIVLTNLGQDEDRERAKALGAKGYFVKSNISIAEIVKQVKAVL